MNLVYFSPVPWTSFAQRPHKFVEWFHAKYGADVLWVDPYPTRLPQLADLRRVKFAVDRRTDSAATLPRWLQVVRPRALPVEPLPCVVLVNQILFQKTVKQINEFLLRSVSVIGVGKPSFLALKFLSKFKEVPSFYDAMDNFPAFYRGLSRHAMIQRENLIVEKVSRILVSSTVLAEKFGYYKSKIVLALNACDPEGLPDQLFYSSVSKQPILGYLGTIGHWFDWQLVISIAVANPIMIIRLIGPIHHAPPSMLPRNIELLPECDHATGIRLMQEFTVGLIPFMQTELTASVDPIKYYEYRALGLPVISTCFGEMLSREKDRGVFLLKNKYDLQAVVQSALAYRPVEEEIEEFRNENSWQARFDSCEIVHSL